MSRIQEILKSKISSTIGDGYRSSPRDIINTRQNFKHLGWYYEDTERPYIDADLDQTIKRFQNEHNLRVDGVMKPRGETERTLNKLLRLKSENRNTLSSNKIEKEELGPPKIPGTNIPDRGIPEDYVPKLRTPQSYKNHPVYRADEDIIIEPPVVDPYMQTEPKKKPFRFPKGRL